MSSILAAVNAPKRPWGMAKWVLLGSAALGCVVCGGGAYWLASALQAEVREEVWSARCGGEELVIEHVWTENRIEGVTTDRHLEGRLGGRTFRLDGEREPRAYTWNPTERVDRGEGQLALHVFVGSDGRAIERCVEANPEGLLAALQSTVPEPHVDGAWTGRRRIYWAGTPDDLVAVFEDGERQLRLDRNGALVLEREFSSSWLGSVVEGPEGWRVEWQHGRLEDEELRRFVDTDGRTLSERLGGR